MQILNKKIANQPFEEFDSNDIDKDTKAARKKFNIPAKMDDCYRLDAMKWPSGCAICRPRPPAAPTLNPERTWLA